MCAVYSHQLTKEARVLRCSQEPFCGSEVAVSLVKVGGCRLNILSQKQTHIHALSEVSTHILQQFAAETSCCLLNLGNLQ